MLDLNQVFISARGEGREGHNTVENKLILFVFTLYTVVEYQSFSIYFSGCYQTSDAVKTQCDSGIYQTHPFCGYDTELEMTEWKSLSR